MQYALEVRDATKRYDQFTLDHVSLRLPRGAIMGLIGENGAGKTTTLKMLLGLIHADEGSVSLLGETTPEGMRRAKERIGVVLDDGFFHSSFKPSEVEAVCRRVYRTWDRETFRRWMQRLSLPMDKKIKELSTGMKMKLSIAVALSHNAELLILDEATSGLDPVVRSEILDVFLEFMQDENHAILFSTHITADLERIADEITFLHQGKVFLSQNKDEMLAQYGVLKCAEREFEALSRDAYINYRKNAFGYEVLLRERGAYRRSHPDAVIDPASLEDIMLYTIKGEGK